MKKVLEHENSVIVWNAKNILDQHGIASVVRNEFAGSAIGELSPIDTWPELWVLDDDDYEPAMALLEGALDEPERGRDWRCQHCFELNGPAFELCWKCGAEAPARWPTRHR